MESWDKIKSHDMSMPFVHRAALCMPAQRLEDRVDGASRVLVLVYKVLLAFGKVERRVAAAKRTQKLCAREVQATIARARKRRKL